MRKIITINLEKLEEGQYLATSNDVQGLVVQGNTIPLVTDIAYDVSRKLLAAQVSPLYLLKNSSGEYQHPVVIEISKI